MRTILNSYVAGGADVDFYSLCYQGSSGAVSSYANYSAAGEDPPPSTWPIFVDTPEAGIWNKYCASSYTIAIVLPGGEVVYHAVTNLNLADQQQAFLDALDQALGL